MRNNDRNLRRRWLRRLAMALVLAMLSAMLPVAALADEAVDETEIYEEPAPEDQEVPDEVSDEPAEEEPGSDEGPEEEPEPQQDPEQTDAPAEEGEDTPPENGEDTEEEKDTGEENDAGDGHEDQDGQDNQDGQVVITGFLPLDKTEFKLSQKPEIELVLKNLPTEVTAEIPGFVDGVPFNVEWTCENYETESYGDFLFTARFIDETAQIGEQTVPMENVVLDEEVLMPVITVTVLAVSGFEPLEEDVYTLDGQPANERSAVKKMKLPKTIKGTLSDSEQVQSFPVTWECENFDGQSEEYLFTAVFSKAAYALEENVEMPAVLLLVSGEKVESLNAPEKQFFPVETKPADEAAALTLMNGRGLLNKLKGKLVGAETEQDFDVVWSCDSYAETSATGEYVFTAALNGGDYDAEGVEMPTVTLKVVSSTEFDIKLNDDETVTILGWTAPETATALVIPASIGGCDVVEVADEAFKAHPAVTSVTLPDTLRKFSETALDESVLPDMVELIVSGDTTLKSDTSFSRMIETKEVTTSLPDKLAVTDLEVRGVLTLDCDYTVYRGHGMEVDSGALVINNAGKTLSNHGAIVGAGTGKISNLGTIYSCQVGSVCTVTVEDGAVVYDHEFDANGRCLHCNAKELIFSFSGTITKTYDGSDQKELTSEELSRFTVTNKEIGEDIRIVSATGYFNGAEAGSHTVTVEFRIETADGAYDYQWDSMTVNGTINRKEISDTSTVTVDDISRQSRSGTDPSVSVYYNGTKLTKGTDYNVSYSYNSSTNVGTATITGIGNFTGTRTKTFNFDNENKEDREVTLKLKSGYELTKVYDSTRNVSIKEPSGTIRANLKASDFEFTNVASGDTVRIAEFGTVTYDDPNAGEHKTVSVTIKRISQSSDKYNYVLANGGKFTFNGKITAKTIEITPTEGQTKIYGAPEPSYFKGTVGNKETGLMYEKDKGNISGKLGREEGEDVGTYKFTTGTLTAGANYNFVIAQVNGKDVTFSITPKDIGKADVSQDPATIPNQKWTGSAIQPDVGLKYQDKTLSKGKDFTIKYSNNVNPGLATIEFTGIGNYQGTRTGQFRILKTAESGTINTGTSSNGMVYGSSSSGFGEGDSTTPGATYGYMQYKATNSEDYILVSIQKKTLYFYHEGQYLMSDFTGSLADGVTVTFPGTDVKLYVRLPSDLVGNPMVRVNDDKVSMTYQEGVDTDALIKQFAPAATEGEAVAEPDEAAQLLGAMVIDGENLGTVLFGEDNLPRGFDLFEEEIVSETVEAPAETEQLSDAVLNGDGISALAVEPAPAQMRLLIQPYAMTDETGAPVYLDAEKTRKKYEPIHLRLTNSQIESLKQRGFVELVYELEYAQIRMPLEALTPDIDLANFREPEEETAPDELFSEEQPVADELEAIDEDDPIGQLAEAAGEEVNELQIAPELLTVSMYDFFIDQVDVQSMTEREKKAMEGMYPLTPLYRVDINAVDGEFAAPTLPDETAAPQPAVRPLPTAAVEPTMYSMLKVFNGTVETSATDGVVIEENDETEATEQSEEVSDEAAVDPTGDVAEETEPEEADVETTEVDPWALGRAKLRVMPMETLEELPEDSRALFVDSDGALLDEDAVTLSDPNYVAEELDSYAEFYPTASGLCALIAPVVDEEEPEAEDEAFESEEKSEAEDEAFEPEEEPEAEDEAFESVEEPEAEDEAFESVEEPEADQAEPQDVPAVTATEAPDANVIEDADAKYAYSRRSNSGDMIWLIDTQAKTVEFYRQDSGKYRIGDYTGSLMSGLTVQYRDNSEIVQMHLKFQQTYKFALTDVDGTEILMEQDDVQMIESELNAVR